MAEEEREGKLERLVHVIGLWPAWLALGVALAGATALIVIQLDTVEEAPNGTTIGLFAIAAASGFAFLAPQLALRGLRQVTRFKVGSVELGLAEIKRAERVRPPQEDDGVRAEPRPRRMGFDDCADKLRRRLVNVRNLLKLKARKHDYAAIAGELRVKGLLNRDEETFVLDLQEYDPLSDDWSSATAEKFLDDTWAFATRFRALVWDRYVRQRLKEDKWFIAGYPQKPGHRPDFLAYRDGVWTLVAARVGSLRADKPDDFDVVARRLHRFKTGPSISSRSIIVPDKARGVFTETLAKEARESVTIRELNEVVPPAS